MILLVLQHWQIYLILFIHLIRISISIDDPPRSSNDFTLTSFCYRVVFPIVKYWKQYCYRFCRDSYFLWHTLFSLLKNFAKHQIPVFSHDNTIVLDSCLLFERMNEIDEWFEYAFYQLSISKLCGTNLRSLPRISFVLKFSKSLSDVVLMHGKSFDCLRWQLVLFFKIESEDTRQMTGMTSCLLKITRVYSEKPKIQQSLFILVVFDCVGSYTRIWFH